MTDVVGRGVIEVAADSSKLEAGLAQAKRSIKGLGKATQDENKKSSDSIDRYIKRLQVQAATVGKSARETKLYELAVRGANKAQLAAADSALKMTERQQRGALMMERVRGRLMSLAAVAGITAGGLVAMFKSTVDGLDALNDLKDATGSSIENISALEDIAARTGTSFDVVSTSLIKFNQVLNAAKDGSEVANIIKKIGLSAEELRRLDPAEAFRRMAVALAGFADDGDKGRAVLALFGKSLREVAPLLNDVAEKAKLVGTVTEEQTAEAEKFNRQLAGLSKNAKDVARDLAGPMVSAINETIAKLKEGAAASKGFFETLRNEQLKLLGIDGGSNVEKLRKQVDQLNLAIANVSKKPLRTPIEEDDLKAWKEQAAALQKRVDLLDKLDTRSRRPPNEGGGKFVLPSVGELPRADEKPKKEKTEFVGPQMSDAMKSALGAISESDISKSRKTTEAVAELNQLLRMGFISATEFDAALEKLRGREIVGPEAPEHVKRLNEALAQTESFKLAAAREEMLFFAAALEQGAISAEQFSEIATAKLGLVGEEAEKMKDAMTEFAEQAARNIQDALGDSLYDMLSGKFDDIGSRFGNLLKRMAAEAAAARIGEMIFGSMGKGSGGFGLVGQIASAFGFGGFFADGGYLAPGKWGIAGEKGPEPIFGGRTGVTVQAAGAGAPVINSSPTIYIDGRLDQASTVQLITGALQANNRQLLEQMRIQGR